MQLPGEFSPFIEKKCFFAQWSGGLPPSPLLVVRPLKKTLFFMCVFPYHNHRNVYIICFFTPDPTDDIQKLRQIGSKDGMIWAGSDLNPGKFLFTDCLDFTKRTLGCRDAFPQSLGYQKKRFYTTILLILRQVIHPNGARTNPRQTYPGQYQTQTGPNLDRHILDRTNPRQDISQTRTHPRHGHILDTDISQTDITQTRTYPRHGHILDKFFSFNLEFD